jgi:hypothetical protein
MGKTVKAVCLKQVFDSKKCIHYRPGDIEEQLDLDNEAALFFKLIPEDRKYAREVEAKRIEAREKEIQEMTSEGFANLYDFRQYKNQIEQVEEGETNVDYVCIKCGKPFDTASQLRGHNMTCGKKEAASIA